MSVTIEEFARDAGAYLDRVLSGETLVLTHDDREAVEIRPLEPGKGLRPIGLCKGQFRVSDDFDDPLPDEIQAAFEGR